MMLAVKEDSPLMSAILEIEELMQKHGISIKGQNIVLSVNDEIEYSIGRDRDMFPRAVDEPFWRYR